MPFISKKIRKSKAALCLLLCLLLALPGLALATDNQNLVLGIVSTTTNMLNPLYPVEREFMSLSALVFESLVVLDDNYTPKPALAEKWEASSDGATWTFTLREGIVFSDGTPLTSNDVVATVNEILRQASDETATVKGAYSSLRYFVNKINAPDERTVVITTGRRNYGFLYAMTFPIVHATQVQMQNPIGTGPYRVENFSPGDNIWLSVNSYWWGAAPHIKQITAIFHANNRDLISSYEYNRVDAILTRSMTAAQYRSSVSSLNLSYRTRQLETLLMNFRAYELEDIRVRKAIRAALNLDGIAQNAYMGMALRTDTPLPSGTWTYQADDALFRQDQDLARKLLEEAGWVDSDGDGIRDMVRNNKTVKLSLRFLVYEEQDSSVRVNVAGQIASQLLAVGIEARTTVLSFREVSEKLAAGSYDLALASFNMDNTPDPGFLLMSGNTGNYTRYNSKEMDQLFADLRKALSREAYQQKLFEIQALYARDLPFISLYYRGGAILTRTMFTATRDIREPDVLRGIEAKQE